MTKTLSAISLAILLAALIFIQYNRNPQEQGDDQFLYLGRCALWTKKFEIAHRFPGSYCSVVPNTGIVARNGDGFMMLGPDNEVAFQVRGIFHHNLYFSDYHNLVFMISASDYKLADGSYGLISNVEGFSVETGEKKFHWDGAEFIKLFENTPNPIGLHDRDIESFKGIGVDWMESKNLKSKKHLFMANNLSIAEASIPESEISKGDLILNIIYPSGFIVLDKNDRKIKKWFPYYGKDVEGIEAHHPTIDGENVLVFLNSVKSPNQDGFQSKVASYSLKDGRLNWIWPKANSDVKLHSEIQGGILKVDTDQYLVYSTFDKEIISLNTKSFDHFNILKRDDFDKLQNIKDGLELVDLKLIPYSDLKNFNFLFLEMLEYEFVTRSDFKNE